MRYYELWIALMGWKSEFTVKEFKGAFASPAAHKVVHDMVKKGFLERTGRGAYRVAAPEEVFRRRTDVSAAYKEVNGAKMAYAFTGPDAVRVWTHGGYTVDRSACFYPIHIKVRKAETKKWLSFFRARGRMVCIAGGKAKETFFGIFYVLYPVNRRFHKTGVEGYSVIPLKETVAFCKDNMYSYEPALEMLDEAYHLGLEVAYREAKTNI